MTSMFKPELLQRVVAMVRRVLRFSIVRFGIVGLVVMLSFMGFNWLFARWLTADWAFLAAYPLSVTLHFCLNKWWTFGCARKDSGRQVGEYLLMVGITFLVQAAVFKAVTHFTPLAPWIAAGVANVAQMVITFLAMQRRIFAPLAPSR